MFIWYSRAGTNRKKKICSFKEHNWNSSCPQRGALQHLRWIAIVLMSLQEYPAHDLVSRSIMGQQIPCLHTLPPPRPCHLDETGLDPIPLHTSEVPGTSWLVWHGDVYIPTPSILTVWWLMPCSHLTLPESLGTGVSILMRFLWQRKDLGQSASFPIYRITVPLKASGYRIWVLTVSNDNANIYLALSTC